MTAIKVTLAMEIMAARFSDRVDDDRSLRVICAVVRGKNLELLDHVGIGVDGCGTVTAWIRNVRSIGGDVDILNEPIRPSLVGGSRSISHKAAIQWTLAATIPVTVNTGDFAGEISRTLHRV